MATRPRLPHAAWILLLASVGPAPGGAADRVILGHLLAVRDPAGAEGGRSVVVAGREAGTDLVAISDPTGDGATLTVIANGTLSTAESYTLDQSGWTTLGAAGFRYAGPTGADGDPVKRVVIKRTPGGVAFVKVLLRGDVGTQALAVVPPNPGNDGGLILDVACGDRYCVKLGGAAGGSERQDTASGWRVIRATAEDGCPAPAPPVCGNQGLEDGEVCDGALHVPSCDPVAGFGCQEAGHPDQCECCVETTDCDPVNGPACCGEGVTSRCILHGTTFCAKCTVGTLCAVPPLPVGIECCGEAWCAWPDVPISGGLNIYCCWPPGHACAADTECCGSSCNAGTGTCDCTPSAQPCVYDGACCSGSCTALVCD
jgi:hypothetical protein